MMHLATSIVMTIGSCYTGSKSLKSSFEKVMVGMLLGFLWDIVLIDMTTHKTSNCCVNDPLGKLIGLMMLFFHVYVDFHPLYPFDFVNYLLFYSPDCCTFYSRRRSLWLVEKILKMIILH